VGAAETQLKKARNLLQLQPLKEAEQQAAIEAARQKQKEAEYGLARKQVLQKTGQFGDKEGNELEMVKAQVEQAKAAVRAEEKKLEELRLNQPQLDIDLAEADLKAKQVDLEKAQKALKECDLVAPEAGIVLRVFVGKGDVLGPNPKTPAMLFCADLP